MFKATVTGTRVSRAQATRAGVSAQTETAIALGHLAKVIERDVKARLHKGPHRGRIVTRYRPERRHVTSAPNDPPANDRGQLVASIRGTVNKTKLLMELSAAAPYAKLLEFGTRRMLPRPFLRPTLAKWRGEINRTIQQAVLRGLRRK